MRNRGNRTMSVSGTSHTTARQRSGRRIARRHQQPAVGAAADGERSCDVRPSATSQSAAASKSSKTCCLSVAHAGLVPRLALLATASEARDGHLPPSSHHVAMNGLHAGVSVMLKPP